MKRKTSTEWANSAVKKKDSAFQQTWDRRYAVHATFFRQYKHLNVSN